LTSRDNLERSKKNYFKGGAHIGVDEMSTARELTGLFIQLGRYSDTEETVRELISESEKL